jgi:hypothetical protein
MPYPHEDHAVDGRLEVARHQSLRPAPEETMTFSKIQDFSPAVTSTPVVGFPDSVDRRLRVNSCPFRVGWGNGPL